MSFQIGRYAQCKYINSIIAIAISTSLQHQQDWFDFNKTGSRFQQVWFDFQDCSINKSNCRDTGSLLITSNVLSATIECFRVLHSESGKDDLSVFQDLDSKNTLYKVKTGITSWFNKDAS